MIRNLQADIALLQNFIKGRQSAGFHDMERMLEGLTIQIFKALNLGNLINVNQIKVNHAAIDLADNSAKVAVQVTSNASPAKVKKTIAAFEKKDSNGISLSSKYKKLYIFGFCGISKQPPEVYCQVIGPDFIIGELVDNAEEDAIQDVADAIRRHQSYSSLHPWEDAACLEIVLNIINRNAIKHRIYCEGNLSDMTVGLKEIEEIIGKGSVNRKQRSKSINEFHDEAIVKFLRSVMHNISEILAIINASRHNDFVNINQRGMIAIDALKEKIAKDSSQIASMNGIDLKIELAQVRI